MPMAFRSELFAHLLSLSTFVSFASVSFGTTTRITCKLRWLRIRLCEMKVWALQGMLPIRSKASSLVTSLSKLTWRFMGSCK